MRKGLRRVMPSEFLRPLDPAFLCDHMRGSRDVSVAALVKLVQYGSGYSANHRVIRLFWHMLEKDLTQQQVLFIYHPCAGSSVTTGPHSIGRYVSCCCSGRALLFPLLTNPSELI
jgi:hypothetical protein